MYLHPRSFDVEIYVLEVKLSEFIAKFKGFLFKKPKCKRERKYGFNYLASVITVLVFYRRFKLWLRQSNSQVSF